MKNAHVMINNRVDNMDAKQEQWIDSTKGRMFSRPLVIALSLMLIIPLLALGFNAETSQQESQNDLNYTTFFYLQEGGTLSPSLNDTEPGTYNCPDFRLITGGGSQALDTWTTPAAIINISIGGQATVRLYAEGSGTGVSFSAVLLKGGEELAAGSSGESTLVNQGEFFDISMSMDEVELAKGDNLELSITFNADMSRGVSLVLGDQTQLSQLQIGSGSIQMDMSTSSQGEAFMVNAEIIHPWGAQRILSVDATITGLADVEGAMPEMIPIEGGGIYIWSWEGLPEGEQEVSIEAIDDYGNTYRLVQTVETGPGGGFLVGGDLLFLAVVLTGIVVVGFIGGITPLHPYWGDKQMRYLIAFSAGIFVSVAVFHAAPEAVEIAGDIAWGALIAGFLTIYVVEHYVIAFLDSKFKASEGQMQTHDGQDTEMHVHTHDGKGPELHLHDHHSKDHAIHNVGDVDSSDLACTHHLHNSSKAAFAGVSFHNLIEGMVITTLFLNPETHAISFIVLFAIILHKAPCTLSISSLLKMGGFSNSSIRKGVLFLLLMTPAGALIGISLMVGAEEGLIGLALAFSAGTFLEIGLLDLVPESMRAKEGRHWALIAFAAGMFLLWLFSLAE